MSANEPPSGSPQTRSFYDREGWKEEGGVFEDARLFGVRHDGPIKQDAHRRRMERVLESIREAGPPLSLLECGCGGNPELRLISLCHKYTGIDFSSTGLAAARRQLEGQSVPFELVEGDVCRLPFPDASFDAVYSANVFYHIPTAEGQAAAYLEAVRVTRPGGVALFVMANPRPLAFPLRLSMRLAADAPGLGALLQSVRKQPVLPYLPMSLGWTQRLLAPHGDLDIRVHAMASTWFAQNVSEDGSAGNAAWRFIRYLESHQPHAAARLGNYVQFVLRKR
jgi:ubiquinone/menaquinone biosynthesis C-methylase UbiE